MFFMGINDQLSEKHACYYICPSARKKLIDVICFVEFIYYFIYIHLYNTNNHSKKVETRLDMVSVLITVNSCCKNLYLILYLIFNLTINCWSSEYILNTVYKQSYIIYLSAQCADSQQVSFYHVWTPSSVGIDLSQ